MHANHRFAAAITSSAKAVELAIKTSILLNNSMGWWDKVFSTHKPLDDIANHAVLKGIIPIVDAQDGSLRSAIIAIERLAPSAPGKNQFASDGEENTEYPYLGLDNSADPTTLKIFHPGEKFGLADSEKHLQTARRTLVAIAGGYKEVADWALKIPPLR
ncbi:MAG TPA: hypothetical protein VGK19_11810 [Capsulimonadaceae bacterium]|jgi:hypothetical protein